MKNFEHANADSIETAIRLLGANGGSRIIAGGTDLLGEMKLGMVAPDRLVNLKTVTDLDYIRFDESNGLKIGALATLAAIADHDVVRDRYPALAEAISLAASPQLRNRGTIAGNLCQDSRCWYFRGPFPCWLKGGEICYARDGENANHAIFGGGLCCTVHPSDPAPALIALRAEVRVIGSKGERALPLDQLFQQPHEGARRLTVLEPAEIIAEIRIPTPDPQSHGTYVKAMDRKAWAFALASVAAQLTLDGNIVREVSLVLGGVAPKPWHVPDAEAAVQGRPLDDAAIARVANLAVAGAQTLRHNGYKIPLVKGLIAEALTTLRA